MIRTQEEIVQRLRTNSTRDPLGWAVNDLMEWLKYEHAREFLQPDVTIDEWAALLAPKPVREQMIEYMPFAWEKANGCRGISASRTLGHYANWLWLLGEDQLAASLEKYEYYGKDHLVKICAFLGLDASQWDDGRRINSDEE